MSVYDGISVDLNELYEEYNKMYFNNELPDSLIIKWSTRMTRNAGYCLIRREKYKGKKEVVYASMVVLSLHYYKKYPNELKDILIHEMLHVKYPNEVHGESFKTEMERLNSTYGLNIRLTSSGHALINYLYICVKCGYEHPRARVIKKLDEYACGVCGSDLQERKVDNDESIL